MKQLLPLNTYEKSIITGACAIHFNEPILHFTAHNLRKRISTIDKAKSRDKAEWIHEHMEPADWKQFLLLYGATLGSDKGKLANGIQKIFSDLDVQVGWFHELFTITALRNYLDSLLWLCDKDVVLYSKRREIVKLKDQANDIIPHIQEYTDKVLNGIVNYNEDQ